MSTTLQGWKILIEGHNGSGVASFVKTVCERKPGKTGLLLSQREEDTQNIGRVAVDRDVVLSFFENTQDDGWAWDEFDQHLLGVIIMLDSTQPEFFQETAEKLNTLTRQSSIPYVLVANKQDIESAWSLDAIRAEMQLPPDTPLMPCVAIDREAVRNVLVHLLQHIQHDIETQRG